jgi:CRP-like cAMP-binding protein
VSVIDGSASNATMADDDDDDGAIDAVVKPLLRGGLWMMTPIGALQLGAPPETLKDTLGQKDGVPRIVVLPARLFDVERGVALADLEFPIYWNLFAKRRPLIVVGREAQRAAVFAAVQESLLGPREQRLDEDVAPGRPVPDLQREQLWFRRGEHYSDGVLDLHDAIDFIAVDGGGDGDGDGDNGNDNDNDGGAIIDRDGHRVVVSVVGDGFVVSVDGAAVATLPGDPPMGAVTGIDDGPASQGPFVPPRFGLTVLGRSHGFDPDPKERTTGFVLWVGGYGVLVDPPVHAAAILAHADIDDDHIDGIILTHVHGDHDAGVLQKAMAAGRIRLWTAPTIYASWLRKWTALSGIPTAELEKLFDFRPIQVGAPVDIHGAKLIFRFTLHSIPALAFEAHYEGASFNYSGDTLNDPAAVDAIHRGGCMDDARREELSYFDWSHDVIFHESGIPPLHTPLERLESLDDDVKSRLRVLHVTPHKLQGRSGLIVAEPGRAHTIELPVETPPEQRVIRNLSILGHTRLFRDLPITRAAELLRNAREMSLSAGEHLIRQGDDGDSLYVVVGGKAIVRRDGKGLKVYGLGDYIGETAVFLRRPRNADVVALTDLELLRVDGEVARRACAGTDVPTLVERHDSVRAKDAWSLLEETSIFRGMTTRQKNLLESLLVPFELGAGHRLGTGGIVSDRLPIIHTGTAVLCDGAHDDDVDAVLVGRGAIVGDAAALLSQTPQVEGAIANGRVSGFYVWRHDLERFLDENPGIRVRIQPWTATETTTNAAVGMARMVTEHLRDG